MKAKKQYFTISDLHFGHENIRKFYYDEGGVDRLVRPDIRTGTWLNQFRDLEDHDDFLIQQWNDTVPDNATVYVLGDVAINRAKGMHKLARLNGRKILVPGNHDIFPAKEYLKYFDDVRAYIVRNGCIFSHIPVHTSQLERFVMNIHGHLHQRWVPYSQADGRADPRYLNVCVEYCKDYKPINMEEVWEYRNSLQIDKTRSGW